MFIGEEVHLVGPEKETLERFIHVEDFFKIVIVEFFLLRLVTTA